MRALNASSQSISYSCFTTSFEDDFKFVREMIDRIVGTSEGFEGGFDASESADGTNRSRSKKNISYLTALRVRNRCHELLHVFLFIRVGYCV